MYYYNIMASGQLQSKFYALPELYTLSPDVVNFFLHWTPPKELPVRYSCFRKPPALRLLHTSHQLALSSHCFQVRTSPGIHRLKTTTNTIHSHVMVKLAFQMDRQPKLETSNFKGKPASRFGWWKKLSHRTRQLNWAKRNVMFHG